ncbi:MAG: hypothetical protein R3B91_12605 [Planctomycetaceae bacterium]
MGEVVVAVFDPFFESLATTIPRARVTQEGSVLGGRRSSAGRPCPVVLRSVGRRDFNCPYTDVVDCECSVGIRYGRGNSAVRANDDLGIREWLTSRIQQAPAELAARAKSDVAPRVCVGGKREYGQTDDQPATAVASPLRDFHFRLPFSERIEMS